MERALKEARIADRHGLGGIFTGVPFAAKDVIDAAGMPTA
ncbi:hypothetical protein [Bradyrhizobium sp. BWA-3-5]